MKARNGMLWLATEWPRYWRWLLLTVVVRAGLPVVTTAQVPPNDTVFVSVYGFPGGSPGNDSTGIGTRQYPFRQLDTAVSRAYWTNRHVILAGPTGRNSSYSRGIYYPYERTLKIVSERGADSTRISAGLTDWNPVTMYADTALQVLEGFTISDNIVTPGEGTPPGGISVYGRGWVINNKILRNAGSGGGGGVEYSGSGGVIAGNWIGGNLDTSSVYSAGGISVTYATALTIVNNTIVGNNGLAGAGIRLDSTTSRITIANNIISGNAPGYGIYSSGPITSSLVQNNLFYRNGSNGSSHVFPFTTLPASNILSQSPMFGNEAGGDNHLTCHSPAINKGSSSLTPPGLTTDIDGQGRFAYTSVDIGGDEFWDTNKQADYIATVTQGCLPLTVSFTNLSECVDEGWFWDFGDGSTLSGQGQSNKSPVHRYDTAGVYTVKLVAYGDADPAGDTLTRISYIRVDKPLTPDFTADVATGCVPLKVTFTASLNTRADTIRWLFGDGQTASGSPVTYTYLSGGKYNVELRATNLCGPSTKQKLSFIDAGAKPKISFSSSYDSTSLPVCSPLTVRFHPGSDQPLHSHAWDFGDNSQSTDSLPSHTYTAGGNYSVRLIAVGDCGIDTLVRSTYIRVGTRPTATVGASPLTGCAGALTASFTATYVGVVSSSTWLFDDGASALGPAAQHTYTAEGVYHPSLILRHICGTDTVPLGNPVTVGVPPAADFSATPLLGFEPLSVSFTDLSANNPTSWQWTFGDAATGTDRNPAHVYSPGIFPVTLTSGNVCGNSVAAKQEYIKVGGFMPSLDSIGTAGDTVLVDVLVDTVVMSYDRPVALSCQLVPVPRRGSMAFSFARSSGTPRFATSMRGIPTGDLASGDYQVRLSAIDPRITKTATHSLHYAGRQYISVAPDTVQFGTRPFGQSVSKSVTVRNTAPLSAGYNLNFTTAVSGGGFDLGTSGGTVNPQNSAAVTVFFAPAQHREYSGRLTINSDDPDKPVMVVVLKGYGIPELIPPQVSATVPPGVMDEVRIDSVIQFFFSEPVITPPESILTRDSVVTAKSKRTGNSVPGRVTFFRQSMGFAPIPCVWFPPDDTINMRLKAVITDTVGNRLDGNKNGADEGTPADDFMFSFKTGPGVFPGDADQNRRVDERDILPVARYWRQSGPPRENLCQGFAMQPATAWETRQATHADANGDGVIDSMDICPIAEFFDIDSSLPKASIEKWMSEARQWNQDIVSALQNGLVACPGEIRGREILHRFLEGLRTSNPIPVDFALSQNYPNPFNPATVIEYSLRSLTHVRLEVFDIQGRLVTILDEGDRPAGRYSKVWDGYDAKGRSVASGIYFYRLTTPEFRFARKMLLLK